MQDDLEPEGDSHLVNSPAAPPRPDFGQYKTPPPGHSRSHGRSQPPARNPSRGATQSRRSAHSEPSSQILFGARGRPDPSFSLNIFAPPEVIGRSSGPSAHAALHSAHNQSRLPGPTLRLGTGPLALPQRQASGSASASTAHPPGANLASSHSAFAHVQQRRPSRDQPRNAQVPAPAPAPASLSASASASHSASAAHSHTSSASMSDAAAASASVFSLPDAFAHQDVPVEPLPDFMQSDEHEHEQAPWIGSLGTPGRGSRSNSISSDNGDINSLPLHLAPASPALHAADSFFPPVQDMQLSLPMSPPRTPAKPPQQQQRGPFDR